jgi:alpha-1,6-mannosyltransferase
VVAEAVCSGLPHVLPDAGGAQDLAVPGACELFRADDVSSCIAAIERLAEDLPSRRRICIAGRDQVRTKESHFRTLFDHYASLARISAAA